MTTKEENIRQARIEYQQTMDLWKSENYLPSFDDEFRLRLRIANQYDIDEDEV